MVLLHATSGPLATAELGSYQASLKGLTDVGSVSPPQLSADKATAAYTITLSVDPTSTTAVHAVEGPDPYRRPRRRPGWLPSWSRRSSLRA